MKQVVRVQTLYSFKQSNGSLIPRGTFSINTPRGIPDQVMQEALAGRPTVRVLEWGKEVEPEKKKVKVEEPVVEEETSEEIKSEEEEPEETVKKPKTTRRKRK